jgi:hypothetical protein
MPGGKASFAVQVLNSANRSTSKKVLGVLGRYGSQAKKVAAGTVMKEHKEKGPAARK